MSTEGKKKKLMFTEMKLSSRFADWQLRNNTTISLSLSSPSSLGGGMTTVIKSEEKQVRFLTFRPALSNLEQITYSMQGHLMIRFRPKQSANPCSSVWLFDS